MRSQPRPHFHTFTSFILCSLLLSTLSAHAATAAFIRVNQIGYESGLSMRAYLMTSAAVSGVSFSVKNSGGRIVASGSAGARLGAWGTYSVYPIDFTLAAADTYTVSVSGPVSATSPAFRVDTPANLYSTPLANNLYFYENERDGTELHSHAVAHRGRTSQRRERHRLQHAHVRRQRQHPRQPEPDRRHHQRRRRMVGRRRLP